MRILIVEDNALLGFMIEECLEEAGHEVRGPVPTVEAALAEVDSLLPDLALVDINLDGERTGIDLARELSGRGVMVFYATGQIEMARAASAHARGVIPKPFSPSLIGEVANAVQAALESGEDVDLPGEVQTFRPALRRTG